MKARNRCVKIANVEALEAGDVHAGRPPSAAPNLAIEHRWAPSEHCLCDVTLATGASAGSCGGFGGGVESFA